MIEHVRRRVALSAAVDQVYVATCDNEIADVVRSAGGHVVMTSATHERASDRVAEVADSVPADIYVMVQGDEPMIVPQMIDLALEPLLADPSVVCSNLISRIDSVDDFIDANTIKVARTCDGWALYLSREPIPSRSRLPFGELPAYKQVCVIPFRRDFLLTYTGLSPTPLEIAESIDMLRAMEHGYRIKLVESGFKTQSVDHPSEIARVSTLMADDPLLASYSCS